MSHRLDFTTEKTICEGVVKMYKAHCKVQNKTLDIIPVPIENSLSEAFYYDYEQMLDTQLKAYERFLKDWSEYDIETILDEVEEEG